MNPSNGFLSNLCHRYEALTRSTASSPETNSFSAGINDIEFVKARQSWEVGNHSAPNMKRNITEVISISSEDDDLHLPSETRHQLFNLGTSSNPFLDPIEISKHEDELSSDENTIFEKNYKQESGCSPKGDSIPWKKSSRPILKGEIEEPESSKIPVKGKELKMKVSKIRKKMIKSFEDRKKYFKKQFLEKNEVNIFSSGSLELSEKLETRNYPNKKMGSSSLKTVIKEGSGDQYKKVVKAIKKTKRKDRKYSEHFPNELHSEGEIPLGDDFDMIIECYSQESEQLDISQVVSNKNKYSFSGNNANIIPKVQTIIHLSHPTVLIGKEYQAEIPPLQKHFNPRKALCKLWDPSKIEEIQIEIFRKKLSNLLNLRPGEISDEKMVELLVDNNYDPNQAIKFVLMNLSHIRSKVVLKKIIAQKESQVQRTRKTIECELLY